MMMMTSASLWEKQQYQRQSITMLCSRTTVTLLIIGAEVI